MNKVSKFFAISCAVGITAFSIAGSASAGEWRHRHHGGGDALAAGVAGLAVGMIAGAAIASPPQPRYYEYDRPVRYYEPPPRYYYRPAPRVYYRPAPVVYDTGLRPWTRSWYNYCANRYRTFDARSGTFVGYDGREHFCVAN